jgi:acetoin:2,6-dichlorophenolindophenol oxidoreductase subunit alpha
MHLFAPDKLAASSGIVGASGPAAAGFALAAQMLRPGTVSLSFFGDGATSAGMLMESMNLAVVWKLPVVFVCKDNDWAISTPASTAVGGDLLARAEAFGLRAFDVDDSDVTAVAAVAEAALQHARSGMGPVFIWAHCVHVEGHFLGDGLLDMVRRPVYSIRKRVWLIVKSLFRKGGNPWQERIGAFREISKQVLAIQEQTRSNKDPLVQTRKALIKLDAVRVQEMEDAVRREIGQIVNIALSPERSLS